MYTKDDPSVQYASHVASHIRFCFPSLGLVCIYNRAVDKHRAQFVDMLHDRATVLLNHQNVFNILAH